jgi:Cu/Ag efflux protein CusF
MRFAVLLVASAFAVASPPSLACDEHAAGHEPAKPATTLVSGWITGEVREVDLEEGTLALRHDRIAVWRMAPMSSMMFKAADPSLIASLNAGDKVRFRAAMVGRQPTVVDIKPANK